MDPCLRLSEEWKIINVGDSVFGPMIFFGEEMKTGWGNRLTTVVFIL